MVTTVRMRTRTRRENKDTLIIRNNLISASDVKEVGFSDMMNDFVLRTGRGRSIVIENNKIESGKSTSVGIGTLGNKYCDLSVVAETFLLLLLLLAAFIPLGSRKKRAKSPTTSLTQGEMSNKDLENELDDKANWPNPIEDHFIHLLYEEAIKDLQTNTLYKNEWAGIKKKLFDKFGKRYNCDKLLQKYQQLRKIHHEFGKLISHTGMAWDQNKNTVQASEEVWASYLKKNKFASRFRSKGCPHYDLLGVIFNNTTTTGQMQYASTNSPPDSDVENDFLTTGSHIGLDREIGSRGFIEGDEGISNKNKRDALFPQSDHTSRSKSSKSTKMDEAIEARAKSRNAKTEVSLARLKRKSEKEVSSPYKELSSVEDCMEILEAMEGVNDDAYMKALDKFTNLDWRKMFVKMSDPRRRVWLNSLLK